MAKRRKKIDPHKVVGMTPEEWMAHEERMRRRKKAKKDVRKAFKTGKK